MDTKKIRKIITTISVACVVLSALIGILVLFKVFGEEVPDFVGQFCLTLLIIFIAGLFLLNSLNAISKKNIFGIVSALMIIISALLFFFAVWIDGLMSNDDGVYLRLVALFSAISIFLNYLVSNYLKLGKQALILQILSYISLFYIELTLVVLAFGSTSLISSWQIFVAVCIVFVALTFVLKFKFKSIESDGVRPASSNGKTVTISVEEYENLKSEIVSLKEKLSKYEN